MKNNILIVSLIIIVILLVVAVNMLSDMYTNKPKKREGFANIAEDPSGQKLNTFLNKGKGKEKETIKLNKEKFLASNSLHSYTPKPDKSDTHINLNDFVLKSSIPPSHKCPSCICPKVSVLAGVGAEAVCPPCPVQRCPPQQKMIMPKCPPPQVCPAPKACPDIGAPHIQVSHIMTPPDADQNTVDWLRQALEATGDDKSEFIQKAIGTLLGKQMDGTGVDFVQAAVDLTVDQKPDFPPNNARLPAESFVNAPKTFTVDGQLI